MRPDVTPGYEEAEVKTVEEHVVRAKRYETQRGAKSFPGPGPLVTMRSSLPEIVIKGCPRCGGDLSKEDVNWGYGDYTCTACSRPWYVLCVETNGLRFMPVSRIADEQPKREGKRKE